MTGQELARYVLRCIEKNSGNEEWAVKHYMISASASHYCSMTAVWTAFGKGLIQSVCELTLKAYNDSLAEMRSQVRDDAAAYYH